MYSTVSFYLKQTTTSQAATIVIILSVVLGSSSSSHNSCMKLLLLLDTHIFLYCTVTFTNTQVQCTLSVFVQLMNGMKEVVSMSNYYH